MPPTIPAELFKKLWQSVLLNAWSDATNGGLLVSAGPKIQKAMRLEAREWLTTPSEDLKLVCEYAGQDYKIVLSVAKSKFGGENGMR